MKWRYFVRAGYITPIALALLLIFSHGILVQTCRIASFPVRMDGFELIVWRYGRRWIDVDFGAVIRWLLIVDFWIMVIWLLIFLIAQSSDRRRQRRRGFEVVPTRPTE